MAAPARQTPVPMAQAGSDVGRDQRPLDAQGTGATQGVEQGGARGGQFRPGGA